MVGEDAQHLLVLVAEGELHRAVLHGLEARGVAERPAELRVLGGRQGGEHRPLLRHHILDALDAGDALEGFAQVISGQQLAGGGELVQQLLEPELGGLVLDDEQHLVVVLRVAHRMLRGEQLVQRQVRPVGHPPGKVGDDPGFEGAFVLGVHAPNISLLSRSSQK